MPSVSSASTFEDKPAGLPCPNSSASFWHSEPSKFLLDHRTTDDLPSSADIVIVGSGITGASIARFLAEDSRANGKSIVLLEARQACWGATGRNGGHCQPLLFDRTPDVAAFEMRNVGTVESYIHDHEVPCEWRKVTGCRAFWDKKLLQATEDEIAQLGKVRPDLGKLVQVVKDAKTMKQNRVKPGAVGITLTEGCGSLWPYKYVTFILEKLVKDGKLNLQTNTPVTSIDQDKGRGLRKIETPRGSIRAGHVILATNGYTSHLLPDFKSLIVPVRCEMSALHSPSGATRLPNSYGFVGYKAQNPVYDDYLIQRPFYESPTADGSRRGGHLMFGGGRGSAEYQCLGVTDDDIVDEGEASYLRRSLLDILELDGDTKDLKELRASHQWTGIKGFSRDDMPWVGKVPGRDGIWLSGGYTGHGMPNATLCGKAVVDMLLAEESGTMYEEICRRLVEAGDLPGSYVISSNRLEKAHQMPTVAVQEEQGKAGASHNPESGTKKTKDSEDNCDVM